MELTRLSWTPPGIASQRSSPGLWIVVSPEYVKRAFEAFSDLDWRAAEVTEMQTLFLRASRI
ncbi:MAG TPA: hypothetical protein VE641_06740, partial [Chthoniobacterales bacterium]|nr:hypothetical protein [Chthoniobacterales bacterium]